MPSYKRPLVGALDTGVPMTCATCGSKRNWPQGIARNSEGRYQCTEPNGGCFDVRTVLDNDRRDAATARGARDHVEVRLPGAYAADYE